MPARLSVSTSYASATTAMTTLPVRPRETSTAVAGAAVPRPRADWGEDDVPVVLRLPDIHALPPAAPAVTTAPAGAPLPEPVRAAQPLPLWLFLVVAAVGMLFGLVALDRWKAYRASNPAKAADIQQPVPAWKESRPTRPRTAATGDGSAEQTAAANDNHSAPPAGPDAWPAEQAVHQAERAGDEVRQAAATGPEPSAAPRNRHFGPSARSNNTGPAPTAEGPAAAPSAAEPGQAMNPESRPMYDSARPSLH